VTLDKVCSCEIRKTHTCRATSPSTEIPAALTWPHVQNVQRKLGEASPTD